MNPLLLPLPCGHFEQMARTHRLRETGHYDPELVDMLIARVRHTKCDLVRLGHRQHVSDCPSL